MNQIEGLIMDKKRTGVELADIFTNHVAKLSNLSFAQENVINRITSCRTAKLGGHLLVCDNAVCSHTEISYNSCQDRHCPKCQSIAKEKWIYDREQELLPVPYFHVVFTIPRLFSSVALQNKKKIYSLLFKVVSQTIKQIASSETQLNAQAGCITVLHTWDQKLFHHPHIHCIVPGGGLAKDKSHWISSNPHFFVPTRILSAIFRAKFLKGMEKLYKQQQLLFYSKLDYLKKPESFKQLLIDSCKNDWVVYARRPFRNTRSVINYLGRYTHRVAISNYRILKMDKDFVLFSYRDRKDNNKQKTLRLPVVDFMKRFLLHVLPKRFMKIRYYGFLASAVKKEMITLCRSFLEAVNLEHIEEETSKESGNWIDLIRRVTGKDPTQCPDCKEGHMRIEHGISCDIGPPGKDLKSA